MIVSYGYGILRPELHCTIKKLPKWELLLVYTLVAIKRALGMSLFVGLLFLASMGKQGAGVHVSQYPVFVFPPVVSRFR
jgi:hypothetical protein